MLNLIIVIIIIIKKKNSNPCVQSDPCELGWVGLLHWVGLVWVEFFFNPPWWVGLKKTPQPDPCP